jgi:hypothetical protein
LNDYCYTKVKYCNEVNSKLDDLTFTLDNQIFTVPVDGYLMGDYEGHPCSAFVSYNSDKTTNYVLGTTFMRNFVISFNYDDTTMTLTSKWPATAAKTYYGMSGVTVLIVLVGVAALLLYIGVLIFCCCKHKMLAKKEAKAELEAKVNDNEGTMPEQQYDSAMVVETIPSEKGYDDQNFNYGTQNEQNSYQ